MTTATQDPWRVASDAAGVVLRIRLTPGSSADAIDGIDEAAGNPVLKARVRAAPENGRANSALEGLLASWLELPKRSVSVISGHKSRTKSVALAGDPLALIAHMKLKVATQIASPRRRING